MTLLRDHPQPRQGIFARRVPHGAGVACTFGLILLLATFDLLTWGINLSVLYIVPLMIYAQTARSRHFPGLGALLMFLTYAKIIIWTPGVVTHPEETLHGFPALLVSQIINRSFVALTLGICTFFLHRWRRFQVQWERSGTPLTDVHANSTLLGQSFDAMGRGVGVTIAITLALAILVTDLFTPGQINSAVLYLVPLTIIGMTIRGRIVWIAAIAFIAMAAIGWTFCPPPSISASPSTQPAITFLWGPAPSRQQIFIPSLVTNRSIACAMLLITAWLLQRFRAHQS